MPTLQINNMPQELYDQLLKSAKGSRRSLSKEAIGQLKKALDKSEVEDTILRKNNALARINKRGKISGVESEQTLIWIREDRDR